MAGIEEAGSVRPGGIRAAGIRWGGPAGAGGYRDTVMRRLVDVVVAALALVLLSLPLLLVALVVRLDSPGPAIFRQVRVGRGGRDFEILKFRSMRADRQAPGPQVSGRGDPRVTRIGRFLRASKLDELPQLVNVLRGEMTLIGPRAEVREYVEHYTPAERELLEVRPGLTGAGQLLFATEQAGELDAAEDTELFYLERQLHPKLALDLEYVRRRGIGADLILILATVRYLMSAAK